MEHQKIGEKRSKLLAYKVGSVSKVRIDSCESICEFLFRFLKGYNATSVVVFDITYIATVVEYQIARIPTIWGKISIGAQPLGVGGHS